MVLSGESLSAEALFRNFVVSVLNSIFEILANIKKIVHD